MLNGFMKMKRKLLLICVIVLFLSLISLLYVTDEDYYQLKENEQNISILLTSSDFSSIYHEKVIINSGHKMKITKSDGVEVIPKNESYCIDSTWCSVGDVLYIKTGENTRINIENINRSYGIGAYFGDLQIYCMNEGFVIVNRLPLETYLRFVVPSEMPSDYGLEALKAQAVCARNFAIQHILNPAYPEFDACLDDSIQFQVYNNQISNEIADKAIKETENMVLTYNSELISTYYYSTSWGHTTDLSLWDGGECPYYKALSLSEKHQYVDLTGEEKFKEFLTENKDAYESAEPWYRWNYFISLEDIKRNINEYLDMEIEKIDSIEIAKRRAGGSVSKLRIADGENCYELTKESEIRNIFIPFNSEITRNDGSVLNGYTKCPSSYYLLEAVYEDDILTGYVISGGGCGHGLGMSQNCAKVLAENGKNYKEILEYFYIGCKVKEYH